MFKAKILFVGPSEVRKLIFFVIKYVFPDVLCFVLSKASLVVVIPVAVVNNRIDALGSKT